MKRLLLALSMSIPFGIIMDRLCEIANPKGMGTIDYIISIIGAICIYNFAYYIAKHLLVKNS